MKKMQDKSSKMKGSTGMRASMASAMADRVKRESFKMKAGAGGGPSISVTDAGSK